MSINHLFEDFRQTDGLQQASFVSEQVADMKLASYENGYQAGWEDALASIRADQGALEKELQESLKSAKLTQSEAIESTVSSFRLLLLEIFKAVFPACAQKTLPHHISDILSQELEKSSSKKITLQVSPDDLDNVETTLASVCKGQDVEIKQSTSMQGGSANIEIAGAETRIDMAKVTEQIETVIEEFCVTILQGGKDD